MTSIRLKILVLITLPVFFALFSGQERFSGGGCSCDRGGGSEAPLPPPSPIFLDRDGDGIADFQDNCPDIPNADQMDGNGNGIGTVCDALEGAIACVNASVCSGGQACLAGICSAPPIIPCSLHGQCP